MDQVYAAPRMELRLPWRISRRGRSRLSRVALVSLWLHLSLLALAILTVRYEHPREEELPPPAEIAMVFQGGRPEGPTVPNPRPEVGLPPQPAPAPTPPAPAPAPPVAAVPPPPAPAPAPRAAAPPLPTPPVPAPPPQSQIAMAIPRPVLPPRPAPLRPPERPAPFPAPMNFSFGRPLAHPAPASPRARGTMDFSLATKGGPFDSTPFSHVAGAEVGPDWRNLLSKWVHDHAYYPEQAAMNGEDGTAMVRVAANPDGRVTEVELRMRSGSVWLDMALQSLFRDARLPPLHSDEGIVFDFTMHYILVRGP